MTNLPTKPGKNQSDGGSGKKSQPTVRKGRPPKVRKLDDNVIDLKKFLELKKKARDEKMLENLAAHSKNTFSNPAAVFKKTEDDRGDIAQREKVARTS